MTGFWRVGLAAGVIVWGVLGCTTSRLPPSESTMSILRSYRIQLEVRVASGQLTRVQARDLYYVKLDEVRPRLPDLGELVEFRKQVQSRVQTKALTPARAEALLEARESDMLVRWEETAVQYASEQRQIERLRQQYERGYWEQKQVEQGEKVFRDRPRL